MSGRPSAVSVAPIHFERKALPGRVSGPSRFRLLQASRVRARSGPLRATMVSADLPSAGLCVAFAIPTTVGCAVDRNLIRRRLRHAFAIFGDVFPPGDILVRVSSGVTTCSWPVLLASVQALAPALAMTSAQPTKAQSTKTEPMKAQAGGALAITGGQNAVGSRRDDGVSVQCGEITP
jgi:ribonuclease P protein component